jgi:hypothetical protein
MPMPVGLFVHQRPEEHRGVPAPAPVGALDLDRADAAVREATVRLSAEPWTTIRPRYPSGIRITTYASVNLERMKYLEISHQVRCRRSNLKWHAS